MRTIDPGYHHIGAIEGLSKLSDELDLTMIDGPYGLSQGGTIRNDPRKGAKVTHFGEWDSNWDHNLYEDVMSAAMNASTKGSASMLVWGPWQRLHDIETMMKRTGWKPMARLVWCKSSYHPVVTREVFATATEDCIWAVNGSAYYRTELGRNWFVHHRAEQGLHFCRKPYDLYLELVSKLCSLNSKVAEPFAGSAPLGEVATRLGMEYYGFELDSDVYNKTRRRAIEEGWWEKTKNEIGKRYSLHNNNEEEEEDEQP